MNLASFFLILYGGNQHMTIKDSLFLLRRCRPLLQLKGLSGKLFQILSLQPFHEIYDLEHDDTSVWTEEKSNTFAMSKLCLHSI